MLALVAVTIRAQNLETERKAPRRPFIALKTNLLFDLALMPNIEAEVPIGNRWSVMVSSCSRGGCSRVTNIVFKSFPAGWKAVTGWAAGKIATTVKYLPGTFSAYMPEVVSMTFNGTVTAIKASSSLPQVSATATTCP